MAAFPKQLLSNPSGFPDLGPAEAIAQGRVLDVIRKHFERAGYAPIETPLVERSEVLFAKTEGEIKNQIYGLRLLNPGAGAESDEKDLALRFDHTVPLARFVAAHYSELSFPFRRYAIGPVLRGERAKEGRYRQFTQADIDVIGENVLSPLHEAEMVAVIADIFSELAIGAFTVRIGHRKVLEGLLRACGVRGETVPQAFRAVDRLEKTNRTEVVSMLVELDAKKKSAEELLDLIMQKNSSAQVLQALSSHRDQLIEAGAAELGAVVEAAKALGVSEQRFCIDLSIARGLDYYTGVVYETRLDEHLDLGSIASGGRYDDLASAFISRKLPGVGISIGVTRLLLRLIKAGLLSAARTTIARVFIASTSDNRSAALKAAAALRAAAVSCEVYLGDKTLGAQLQLAEQRGFALAISAKDATTFVIHNLATSEKLESFVDQLVSSLQKLLA